jgi:hypothetical protein
VKTKVAITVSLAVFVTAIAALCFRPGPRSLPFNSAQWKVGDEVLRGKMVRELPGSPLLLGKDDKQVLEVLGKPDGMSETKWAYHVDTGIRFLDRKWPYSLTVTFYSNKVTNVELHD